MKVINLKKKNIFKFSALLTFALIILAVSTSFGMQNYYKVDFSTGLVTASTLNVRSGPGTAYKVVATAKKNDYIRVFAGIGNWYVVQVDGDYIGVVSKQYVKPIYPGTSTTTKTQTNVVGSNTTNSNLSSDEKEVFDLINKQRTNNGL